MKVQGIPFIVIITLKMWESYCFLITMRMCNKIAKMLDKREKEGDRAKERETKN